MLKLCEQEAVALLKDGIDLVPESDKVLVNLLSYPLRETLARCFLNFKFLKARFAFLIHVLLEFLYDLFPGCCQLVTIFISLGL